MEEKKLTLLDHAIIFATKAHSGTTRKGTNVPYIVHPIEAAAIVSAMTDDEEVIAAAVLHDVLEDTEATREDLLARFGRRITNLVENESEDKRKNQCIIGDKVWERFNEKDKNMHAWMYRSIAEALKELSDHPMWQEYSRLVNQVFGEEANET